MASAFELFPRGVTEHSAPWRRALDLIVLGGFERTCPGKDTLDTKCTCPDLMYATKIRILHGTYSSRFYCGCCDLPLASPPPV